MPGMAAGAEAICGSDLPPPEWPTIFSPAGPAAAELHSVTWLLVGICGAIFVVVQAALLHTIVSSLRAVYS